MDQKTQLITPAQMKRLQVLYGQLARHTQEGVDRASRLAWASQLVRRPIVSFKELTLADARHLIDTIQGQLGIKTPARPRHRLDRQTAKKAGTEGRRGQVSNETTLAGPSEFARIRYVLDLIGWSQAQLDSWLHSPRSPLSHKATPSIRTLGDANRVYWALKGMATAQGKWGRTA
jgi:hypothetical protein